MPTARPANPNPYLPPHLREVCALLAAGLVRLRRHTSDDAVRDGAQFGDEGESSLHFVADQSGHANPTPRRQA